MTDKNAGAKIIKRFEQLWSQRKTVEQVWQVITRFIQPYRGEFFKEVHSEHSVEWRNREIYDSTAVMAAQSLAASLHSGMTSPAIRWFEFKFRDEELNKNQEAREWLEACSQRVYHALQDSNFNLEVNELYLDLVGPGTGFIVEEAVADPTNDWEGLSFTCVPVKEAYFEQTAKGQIYRFYRLMNWTTSRYIDKFGAENCPKLIIDKHEQNPDETVEVIFCIYLVAENKEADVRGILAPDRRPYGFKYLLRQGGEAFRGPRGSGGYYEMPAFAPRWRKTSESMYGNSPSTVALADVLTLNQTVEMRIKAIEKRLDPPQKVEERALLADLDLKARGITIMRDITKIAPIDTGADINAGEIEINDLRQAIRTYFFVDQLELKDSPAMTATEVMVRAEMMQRLFGPTQGRIESDFIEPMLGLSFASMYRANRLPDVPEVVSKSDSQLDITYLGPLTRAQKSDQVSSTERWMDTLQRISEVLPDVLDIPDAHAIARGTANMLSVPAGMQRSDIEAKKMKKEREKAIEAAQQAALMRETGEGMKSMGEGEQAFEVGGG